MSSLKYKSTTNPSSSSGANNLPIWCSLSTPSQIARKYASIAPIWCHISRPRQLKQKFKSTFNTATNLLSRQHSKDDRSHVRDNSDDGNRFNDMNTAINTFKNANNTWKSSNVSANMPSSSSKNKISVNNYDNSELTSILKKRENSLELKKNALTSPYNTSVGSRWTSSIKKPENSTYDNNNASTIVGSFYEENHLPSMSSHTGESSRRPNKYVSKYSGGKGVGSKTEKIISKSSKSSPNLLTDRYEPSTGSKWQSSNYTPSNQYHSSNYGSGNNYSSYNYQPITTSSSNNAVSSSYNKNNDNFNNNNNREEKWNELDTMLGAQSALLSRLESDFVNNRNKLKNPSSNTTNSNNNNNNNNSSYSNIAGQRNAIGSLNTPSYQSNSNLMNNKYGMDNKPTKKPLKYTSSKTEKINHNDSSENHFQKFSSKKAEPIIDLLNSLDLNEGPREKQTEMTENYNLEIDSKLKSNKEPISNNKNENMDEFVDDFINDYLGNTLKATEPTNQLKPNKISSLNNVNNLNNSANSINSNTKLNNNNVLSTTSLITQPNRTNSTSSITSANSTNNPVNYNGNPINLNTLNSAVSVNELSAGKINEKSEPEPMKSNWYRICLFKKSDVFVFF